MPSRTNPEHVVAAGNPSVLLVFAHRAAPAAFVTCAGIGRRLGHRPGPATCHIFRGFGSPLREQPGNAWTEHLVAAFAGARHLYARECRGEQVGAVVGRGTSWQLHAWL